MLKKKVGNIEDTSLPQISPEDETSPLDQQKPFQIKVNDNNEEEEDELIIAICYQGECIQVDMDLATAHRFCDAANELLASSDPKDHAKAKQSWKFLSQGKESEAMQLLGVGSKENLEKHTEPDPEPTAPSPLSTTPKPR